MAVRKEFLAPVAASVGPVEVILGPSDVDDDDDDGFSSLSPAKNGIFKESLVSSAREGGDCIECPKGMGVPGLCVT